MDPQILLRGLAKFAAVVVAAALAGAGIGIVLAKLSGNESTSDPVLPLTTASTATSPKASTTASTATTAATSTTASTSTTPASTTTPATGTKAIYRVPRVTVQSALLGPVAASNGKALVAVRVSVTNRGNRPLTIKTPALLSGKDVVALGPTRRPAAGALLKPIAPGATAAGVLRFSVAPAIAQRLTATPAARLQVGNRIVAVKLTTNQPPAP